MLSIIYSKKGNLVPRLKISEGCYKYEIEKIKPFIESNIRALEEELSRLQTQLKQAEDMQEVCNIYFGINEARNGNAKLIKEVAL